MTRVLAAVVLACLACGAEPVALDAGRVDQCLSGNRRPCVADGGALGESRCVFDEAQARSVWGACDAR